jgi:hypothetical protein
MIVKYKILLYSTGFTLFIWIADSLLDSFFPKIGPTHVFLFNLTGDKFFINCLFVIILISYGIIITGILDKKEKIEKSLIESKKELSKKEEMLSTVIDSMPQSIFWKDRNSAYLGCNEKYARAVRFEKPELLVGKNDHDLPYSNEKAVIYRQEDNKVMDTGVISRKVTNSLLSDDGFQHWFEIIKTPLLDKNNNIFGVLGVFEDITERKQALEELKESEERFRSLVESFHDITLITSNNFELIYANPALEVQTGYSKQNFLKKENFNSEDIDRYLFYFNEFRDNGILHSKSIEARYYDIWGKIHWVSTVTSRIIFKGELAFLHVMRDITENKEVEIALQESEELYRKLITTIPDIIVRTTLKGDIIFVNEANFPFSNTVQPVNILGKNILSFVAPKDHDRAIQDLLMMFDKQMGPQEYRLILDEDNQIDSEIKGDILRDFNDNPYGLVLIIRDITQRKLAEEALRESEIKYKLLFNSSNDYILIHEIEKDGLPGKFTDVNDIACQRLGYSREELLQFSPFDIDDPQYVKIIPDMMKKLSEDKHAVWEGMHIAKDGSRIPVEISNRLFIMNGKSTILATIRDITDRKKNEIELQNYRQHLEELIKERTLELESVNRLLQEEVIKQKDSEKIVKLALEKEKEFSDLKSKFISIASHEFRTPLSIIYSSTELLERYGQNWDSLNYVKQIERIKLNIISLTEIMDDVLTLSRTEINKKQFSPKTKDLYKLCCNIKNDIKLLLSESQQFTFNYLPTERIFQFDEKLIRYILLNLLSNAVKYSGANGKILFNVMLEGGNLVFSIQDEGIGIPESDQEFLYEPFHRGSNVGEIKGTGLGMSIIRRFVDLHFGSIFFQSKENVGTKFTVHIPVKQNY